MISSNACSFSAQIAARKQQWFLKELLALLSLSTARVWSVRYKHLANILLLIEMSWPFFLFLITLYVKGPLTASVLCGRPKITQSLLYCSFPVCYGATQDLIHKVN